MFGAGQKLLDKMRLSDRWAIAILFGIIIGLIIPPIKITNSISFSIGGFLIPVGVCVYLLIKVGLSSDLARAVVGSIITAVVITLLQILLPAETPQDIIVDNHYIYGVVAGLTAYILGRSRRNAFISSVFGITLSSVFVMIYNLFMGLPAVLHLGVGGISTTLILSALIAVGLAELVGKTIEIVNPDEKKVYNFEAGKFEHFNEIEEIENHEEKKDEKDI
jgi:hypothetical protein